MDIAVIWTVAWIAFSVASYMCGSHLLTIARRRWVAVFGVYLIAQCFAWTVLWAASSCGAAVVPAPDIVAIYLFSTGSFFSGSYGGCGCIPPPFITSILAFIVAWAIRAGQRPDLLIPSWIEEWIVKRENARRVRDNILTISWIRHATEFGPKLRRGQKKISDDQIEP